MSMNTTDASFQTVDDHIDTVIQIELVVVLTLLSIIFILSKYLHARPKLAAILPEAGMVILFSIAVGFMFDLYRGDRPWNEISTNTTALEATVLRKHSMKEHITRVLLSFSSSSFFYAMLPPIIYNAGYNLKREIFLRHLKPITLFAVIGTTVSALTITVILQIAKQWNLTGGFKPTLVEILTFGSLISATDPISTLAVFQAKQVDPQLFYLVFGESVLNDGVGYVLFATCSSLLNKVNEDDSPREILVTVLEFLGSLTYIFVGSTIFGILVGLFAAYLYSKVDMSHTPLHELGLFIIIVYLPYFLANLLGFSGIISIFLIAMMAKRFAAPNLSCETQRNADAVFRILAHVAETYVFLELGMSVFGISSAGSFNLPFILWAILACLIGRIVNVYPITFFFNRSLGTQMESQPDNSLSLTENDSDDIEDEVKTLKHISSKNDLRINRNVAHVLWFSGLRGGVAYACARAFPNEYGNREVFVVTTMAITLFTVFGFGCTTDLVLNVMSVDQSVDEDEYMNLNETVEKIARFQAWGTYSLFAYYLCSILFVLIYT